MEEIGQRSERGNMSRRMSKEIFTFSRPGSPEYEYQFLLSLLYVAYLSLCNGGVGIEEYGVPPDCASPPAIGVKAL